MKHSSVLKKNTLAKKIKFIVSYDGTRFKGWQKQTLTPLTIQNHLEQALSQIYSMPISVVGAGRTDAGVHALAQCAHFRLPQKPTPSQLVQRINALTPKDISCHKAWLTPPEFHAQTSALKRTYQYIIWTSPTPSAFKHPYGLWHPRPLNYQNLQALAQELLGEKDFQSFQNSGSTVSTTLRTVYSARWIQKPHMFVFQISANSFLKQMVRNLVGAQLHLMNTKNPTQTLKAFLNMKSREKAPYQTAPAQGLFLHHISYPSSLDRKCQKL